MRLVQLVLLTLCAAGPPALAQERFLCVDGFSSSLLELDPATAVTTPVGGLVPHTWLGCLARDPATGWLYGVEPHSRALVRVHPETGGATFVGTLSVPALVRGLAFLPGGGLVAAGSGTAYGPATLYKLDAATGNMSAIGPMGVDAVSALDVDPTTGLLWAALGPNSGAPGGLVLVDPLTGNGAPLVPTQRLSAIAFDGTGTLYGIDDRQSNYLFSTLYVIDPGTGAAQWVGTMSERDVEGLVVVPAPDVSSYCTGAPNSVGAGARMTWSGSTSVWNDDLVLGAWGCPPNRFGLFYYGASATQVPLGDGYRCVGPPFHRLPIVQIGAAGTASYALDLANPPSPAGSIGIGDTVHFQLWYRDLGGPGGSGSNLSDGLRVAFRP